MNSSVEAYRVYDGEDPILLGFIFKHLESNLWHAEYPRLNIYMCGLDKEILLKKLIKTVKHALEKENS
jgi:hypothetical protein